MGWTVELHRVLIKYIGLATNGAYPGTVFQWVRIEFTFQLVEVERQGNGDSLLHKRGRLAFHIRRDEIERTQLIRFSPTTPVGYFIEPLLKLLPAYGLGVRFC